eukprot:g3731.t1
MQLLAVKSTAKVLAVRIQRAFNLTCQNIPKVFKREQQNCCLAPRTDSISISETIVRNENQQRNEQRERAKKVALSIVKNKNISRQQLSDRLNERGVFDGDTVQDTVNQMIKLNLQNKLKFAVEFICTKWEIEKWSFKKIESELKSRHLLSTKVIDKAFRESFFCIHDEEYENEYYFYTLLRRIQTRVDGPLSQLDIAAKKRRVSSWLNKHNYSCGIVYRVMNEVDWKKNGVSK